MDARADCFVLGLLATVLRVSRLTGIAPVRFVKKHNGWRINVSVGWTIYGYLICIIVGICVGLVVYDMSAFLFMVPLHPRFIAVIAHLTLTIIILCTAIFKTPNMTRSMITCLNQLEKINYQLNVPWPKHSKKKQIVLYILWTVVLLLLLSADFGMAWVAARQSSLWVILSCLFYYCCSCTLHFRQMLFAIFARHVISIFRDINDSLRNLLYDDITKVRRPNHMAVRRLAHAYASACDVVRQVNGSHGLVLLLMLGSLQLRLLIAISFLVFDSLKVITENGFNTSLPMHICNAVIQLLRCFYEILSLAMVVESCHLTHMEMKITRELVSHLLHSTQSAYEPLAVELEMFFRYLVLNDVSYSPLKVTKISRSLVVTMIGTVTTYIAMFIGN